MLKCYQSSSIIGWHTRSILPIEGGNVAIDNNLGDKGGRGVLRLVRHELQGLRVHLLQ